jgi:CRISPR-associated endonuclease/helicase Cas3
VTTIHLEGRSEKLAPEDPWGLERRPLYHQLRTYRALEERDLVVNTYYTGTGKTVASLLYLFELDGQDKNVLFVAPTNALLHQHAADIQRFVEAHDLGFLVVEMHADRLRRLMEQGDRPGETLQRLIQNPLTYARELQEMGIPLDGRRRSPIVLVVNPDIFYYALYFRYGSHDQRNMFERILTAFDYVVIDEFHYYDSKQLASFLFFFVISQQFGYFERGRRICLLSATPNECVLAYLGCIFDEDEWALIAPENEPAESADYGTTRVLTSLRLEVVEAEAQDWASHHEDELAAWLDEGQDGALISSALWRVNACFTALRRRIDEGRIGRITGPEPEEKRQQATARRLILATPTVDIGYNFDKLGKPRQNIDFLVCDARYGDELLQRLGRAGRVLGKAEQDVPSRAVALLGEEACRALAHRDGETLSRGAFAQIVADVEALPPKQTLYNYIRTHAITECFYPIYQMERMMPDDLQHEMDALYERVRRVFAPTSRRPSWSLRTFFRKQWRREQWLRENKEDVSASRRTAVQLVDWFKWCKGEAYDAADWEPYLADMGDLMKRELCEFVAGQVHLTNSLFSFRDSFQGPLAVVHDPQHLLSSETVNSYGLMHVVANYKVRWLQGRREFARVFGEPPERGALYGVIEGWREPRLSLELSYHSRWPAAEFHSRLCRRPVAVPGMRLVGRERGGDKYPLDPRITRVFEDNYVSALLIRPEDVGAVYSRLGGTTMYIRRLTVSFPDGRIREGYAALLGTQAFQAHAELLSYFFMRDRLEGEAIII